VSVRQGQLSGRVAVVTGGASGIGAAVVRAFAEAGGCGAALDRAGGSAASPAGFDVPDGWLALTADVRDARALESAFATVTRTFGRLDVVVANAGIVPPWTTVATMSPEEWDEVFAVNARGVMLTVREAVRSIRGGGSIIAMSSVSGWKGDAHVPAYVASKHAVVGLVRSVALEVGRQGIRVSAVGPGPVATEALLSRMAARSVAGGAAVEEALRQASEPTALGRMATVEEVADAVLFLACDLSSGITGQLLRVDAGVL
jgi:NAD(P)-dependent dehydrogenase (short-subunit alcohol dehydrogenase family)